MYNLDDIILLNSIMNPTTDSIIVCIGLLFFFIYYIIWMSYVKKLKQLDPIVEKCRNKSEFFRNECDVLKKKLKAKIVTELVLKDLFLDSTSVFGILKGIYKYKTNDAIQELDDLSVILSYPVHFVETAKQMNGLTIVVFIMCVVGAISFDSYIFLLVSGVWLIASAVLEGEKKEKMIYFKDSNLFIKLEICEYGDRRLYYFSENEPVLVAEVIVKYGSEFYSNSFEKNL